MKPIIKWQAFIYNYEEKRFEFDEGEDWVRIGDTEFDTKEEAIKVAYERNPYLNWYFIEVVRFASSWEMIHK